MTDIESIMHEGYRACHNGDSIDSSPYQFGTDENEQWVIGYNEALEEV